MIELHGFDERDDDMTTQTDGHFNIVEMSGDQRKAVALEYFLRMDRGDDFLDLFDDNATVYFPKWGIARGRSEYSRLFSELMGILKQIEHHSAYSNFIIQDDRVVVEGTSSGVTATNVEWRVGVTFAGRWCDVFEIRNFKIQRLFIYLDPDYSGEDVERYPWLANQDANHPR